MLKVWTCIVEQHDLRLVGLAVIICALASFTAITLLHHARKSTGRMHRLWLAVSAVSTGFGIWATHFIAMLAFSPGIPSGYNIALTFLSLVAAIILTGIGLRIALKSFNAAPWIGGAIVGGGIAAMHYTGMAAFEVMGHVVWDPALVAASIALGAVIGSVSLPAGLHASNLKWKIIGAALLTAAIASHHFTAMGAVTIIPDTRLTVPPTALPVGWLAILVALASIGIIVLTFAGLALDIRDRRRTELEADRMRGLANAAVEGLIVSDGETVVTANTSFALLAGSTVDELVGAPLDRFFRDKGVRSRLMERPNEPLETYLAVAGGSTIPIELILRPVDFAGRPHHAIAVRDLRARKQAEQSIRFLAHHDSLTSLPNRSSFNKKLDQEIEAARQGQWRLAVLCLDLDRFKEVNDLFGHAAGDGVLKAVARSVGDLLDDNQMLARLSGDEFAIVLPRLVSPAAAGVVAEKVLEAVAAATGSITGTALTTSIGIAIYPDDAAERQALMSNADTALYGAKRDGRAGYRFFEAAMGAAVRDRRLLEHDLRLAISRNELSVVYQPQLDIKTNEVIGFEALLRWHHATRGDIPPEIFIGIAEEGGAILPIGEWVLRKACAEAARWTRPLGVAVNVSAVQLHSPSFVSMVHSILIQTGLSPMRLEIEVTETALIRDLNRAVAALRQLKNLGVRIAMDDFGTGYSSLSNLRAFPFDKIKVDRSFIKAVDHNDQAATIVRAVLGLGRGLGLPVLAEGVETQGELEFLLHEMCDEAQGYLLGMPSQIEEFRYVTHGEAKPGPKVTPLRPKSVLAG